MSYLPEAQLPLDLPVKHLTMAAVNINSITNPGRLSELQYFVDDNQIDILAVSEMKIDHTVHPCLFSLQNFHQPFIKPRTRRGGGVGIYIRRSLPVSRAIDLENDEFEAVWVKIKVKNKQIIICSSYLPPHTPADNQQRYLDFLTDSVTKAYARSPALVAVLGDQNAGNCWLPPDAPRHSTISPFENKFKSTTEALGLAQIITTATRIQNDTHNLRALILVDSPDSVTSSGVLSSFSNLDHFPVYCTLSIGYSTMRNVISTRVLDYKKH